ncbi:UNVERIFIED_ASMBLY: hypothetical protein SD1_15 [Shigella phage 2019SD1]|uniref:Uncharacterized protein n=1 Tax=Shigella phage 2019SD1 TaxID=2848074 RepID=A0A6M5C9S1_9CAUD|nr:tail length tape measure protein [Shigella phage 2019SD1]
MSEQYAGLTLGVDVSQLNNAVKSLQQFKKANDDAKGSVENFVDSEVVARQRAKQLAEELAKQKQEFKAIQSAIDPTASKMDKLRQAATQLDALWKKELCRMIHSLNPDDTFFELGSILETQQNKLIATKKALTEEGRAAIEEAKNKAGQRLRPESSLRHYRHKQTQRKNKIRACRNESRTTWSRAAQLGVSAEAAPFIAKMKEQEKQASKLGVSMGQYKQAMAQLPMQITDVVTSLASGMPVWMVAIQQGGQIKDSFGGVANTFKALMTFVTPLSVGMTALTGALGYAAYNAYKTNAQLKEITKPFRGNWSFWSEQYAGLTLGVDVSQLNNAVKSLQQFKKANDDAKGSVENFVDSEVVARQRAKQLAEELAKQKQEFKAIQSAIDPTASKMDKLRQAATQLDALWKKELCRMIHSLNLQFAKNTYEDIGKIVKDANKDMAERAARIDRENLSLNRVRAAQEALNKAIEDQKNVARTADEELKNERLRTLSSGEKSLKRRRRRSSKGESWRSCKSTNRAAAKEKAEIGDQIVLQQRKNKQYRTGLNSFSKLQMPLMLNLRQSGATDMQIKRELELKKLRTDYVAGGVVSTMKFISRWKQSDMYGNVQDIASEALNGLTNQMATFLATGKANFKSFATSIIQMIIQMITKMVIFNAISGAIGGDTWTIGSLLKMLDLQLVDTLATAGSMSQQVLSIKASLSTKEATKRIGVGNLYKMMRGYANGGVVGGTSYTGGGISSGATNLNIGGISVDINNGNDPKGLETGVKMIFTDMIKRSCTQGGEVYEFVMSKRGDSETTKEATKRIGVGNLYKMMRGYANGGVVGGTSYTGGGISSGATNLNIGGISVDINNGNDPKGLETGVKMIFTDMIKRSCTQGGEVYEFVMSKRGDSET